ncbi:MAG: amidase [Spirochaetota bacterium]
MKLNEYNNYDATGLAELIRKRKVSIKEVVTAAIERIDNYNPVLNAVITPMYDNIDDISKKLPKGHFYGVPFLIKDLLTTYKGIRMASGCRAYLNYIPDFDSEVAKRYKNAGLVILGKTNTPEFGLVGYTEPEAFGPTRNPWNTDLTPGGSSGGSAAAVASGMVPFAGGGDGGGSIRIPSAYCGLFGLKPSRGRVPSGPEYGQIWQGAAVEHVLTRSVRDSAAMLDILQGSDPGAPYIIEPPKMPYSQEIQKSPGKLKIAISTDSPIGTPVHHECKNAAMEAAKLCEKLGHYVEIDKPHIDGLALAKSYLMLYFGEVAADIQTIGIRLGRKPKLSDVEVTTWTLALLGRTYSAGDFVMALREWNKAARAMGHFFTKYDIYLTPTTAQPPAPIGSLTPKPIEMFASKIMNIFGLGGLLKTSGIVDQLAVQSLSQVPFTQLANLTGIPAMSVPLHWGPDGLPYGVQFMAAFGQEALLFRLAAQLEKAKPWFNKQPKVLSLR